MTSCKMYRAAYNILTCQLRSYNQNVKFINTFAVSDRKKMANKKIKRKSNNNANDIYPGIGRRLQILKKDTPDIESKSSLDEEDFEGLEGDFMNAREMENYHISTAKILKCKEELKITERKHFKTAPEPNMLTWSEKNQIKLLHSQDPMEWNFDKLADSFPATPEIIKKIIKSSWKPESENRLIAHDEKVSRNWKAFNEGKLQINNILLKEHLQKFTNRILLPQHSDVVKIFKKDLPKPQKTEFANIIQSYKLLNENTVSEENLHDHDSNSKFQEAKTIKDTNEENNALIHSDVDDFNRYNETKPLLVSNKKTYTLSKLRKELKDQRSKFDVKDITEQDRELLKEETSTTAVVSNANNELNVITSQETGITDIVETNKNIMKHQSHSNLPDHVDRDISNNNTNYIKFRIHIPKSKVKGGYLYKVEDCFYSHDGFFLYRVPGINTNRS